MKKVKAKSNKADAVFDEAASISGKLGQSLRSKQEPADCYIFRDHIFIFFKNNKYVLVMTNKDDIEARVMAALVLGNKINAVMRFEEGEEEGVILSTDKS